MVARPLHNLSSDLEEVDFGLMTPQDIHLVNHTKTSVHESCQENTGSSYPASFPEHALTSAVSFHSSASFKVIKLCTFALLIISLCLLSCTWDPVILT